MMHNDRYKQMQQTNEKALKLFEIYNHVSCKIRVILFVDRDDLNYTLPIQYQQLKLTDGLQKRLKSL